MATTGSKDDIKFLIRSLSEDRDIEATIFSLGVLKADESLGALKKVVSKKTVLIHFKYCKSSYKQNKNGREGSTV